MLLGRPPKPARPLSRPSRAQKSPPAPLVLAACTAAALLVYAASTFHSSSSAASILQRAQPGREAHPRLLSERASIAGQQPHQALLRHLSLRRIRNAKELQHTEQDVLLKSTLAGDQGVAADWADSEGEPVNPDKLTEEQERLLKLAIARQSRHSVNAKLISKQQQRDKLKGERDRKLQLLQDHRNLQSYLNTTDYAGGPVQLANVWSTLSTLRHHLNCTLPVELYFNGSAEMDVTSQGAFEAEFAPLRAVDGSLIPWPPHINVTLSPQHAGWTFKAFALYSTTFQEVLMLDADNLPLADPSYLFQEAGFATNGSLFWPDFWDTNWMNPGPAYSFFGLPSPWGTHPHQLTTESGQLLLDRSRYVDVLEWILFLNANADVLYTLVWGDKDLYELGFALAGLLQHYTQIQHRPAEALVQSFDRSGRTDTASGQVTRFRHAAMLQMDPGGSIVFWHRTSDAKLDPHRFLPPWAAQAQYLTLPLSPAHAMQVHGGGLCLGACKGGTMLEIQGCKVQGRALLPALNACGISTGESDGPVPAFHISALPEVHATVASALAAFQQVQVRYLEGHLRLGNGTRTLD